VCRIPSGRKRPRLSLVQGFLKRHGLTTVEVLLELLQLGGVNGRVQLASAGTKVVRKALTARAKAVKTGQVGRDAQGRFQPGTTGVALTTPPTSGGVVVRPPPPTPAPVQGRFDPNTGETLTIAVGSLTEVQSVPGAKMGQLVIARMKWLNGSRVARTYDVTAQRRAVINQRVGDPILVRTPTAATELAQINKREDFLRPQPNVVVTDEELRLFIGSRWISNDPSIGHATPKAENIVVGGTQVRFGWTAAQVVRQLMAQANDTQPGPGRDAGLANGG